MREDSESILIWPIWHLCHQTIEVALQVTAFSFDRVFNQMMYKGELTIFPNANESNDDLGVELVEVNGFYLNRRNEIEAKEIVKAAVNHMENNHIIRWVLHYEF